MTKLKWRDAPKELPTSSLVEQFLTKDCLLIININCKKTIRIDYGMNSKNKKNVNVTIKT